MKNILKYTAVIFLSTFAWADNHWQKKKKDFAQHTYEFHQRKTNKLQSKAVHIQHKQKWNTKKSQFKWAFLENRLQINNREKAKQLFKPFINPKKNNKQSSKRKFIENKTKSKKLKEKYPIPLEEQLFL